MTVLWQTSAPERRILGAGLCVALVPLLFYVFSEPGTEVSQVVLGYALASIPFGCVCLSWRNLGDDRTVLVRILIVALMARLLLLWVPPVLSEDLWRYIWDGMHVWDGLSPYRFPPSATSEDIFSAQHNLSEVRRQIGHSEITTVYPPFAQLSFAVGTVFGPHPLNIRLTMIAADLVTIGALWSWASATQRPPQLAVLFAFAPLTILESSIGSHVDCVGVAALTVAGALYARRATLGPALAATFAIGVKLVPVLLLLHWLRRRWRPAVAAFAISFVFFGLFFMKYPGDSEGLSTFAHRWRANDGLFALIYSAFEWVWPNDGKAIQVAPWCIDLVRGLVGGTAIPGGVWPDELAFACTKVCAGAIVVISLFFAILRTRTTEAFWLWVMGTILLISPVVHPWYLLWVFPCALLFLSREEGGWGWGFVLWSQLIWLAYLPRQQYVISGVWVESDWVRWVEYLPVLIVLALVAFRARTAPLGALLEPSTQEEFDIPMPPEDG